jgi:hypothetical protein
MQQLGFKQESSRRGQIHGTPSHFYIQTYGRQASLLVCFCVFSFALHQLQDSDGQLHRLNRQQRRCKNAPFVLACALAMLNQKPVTYKLMLLEAKSRAMLVL